MKPGDLVMPKGSFLRMIDPYPHNPPPGIVLERIYGSQHHLPGARGCWHVLWRGGKHVMFDNEIVLLESSNV
jgi:hypothetical protein